ncbi:hypothetical protein BC939DRAFT_525602 [Gamsiella multidivaricata]|uniref:uncharacterized protein n=1 Tax=Gamsiella multidivaricata TaxID=101098 RepID=UPI00221FA362|nr:uncharacterized protein BC939DRAFT_525602 [Gamsiella multidivaricata]KAI7830396.1 hypothetical protein BC939DRAFT_525602 [Gamsiella multidivaricata]
MIPPTTIVTKEASLITKPLRSLHLHYTGSRLAETYGNSPDLLRDIQLQFQCCGFHDVLDRAIPKDYPSICHDSPDFGFSKSCEDRLTTISLSTSSAKSNMLSEHYQNNYWGRPCNSWRLW